MTTTIGSPPQMPEGAFAFNGAQAFMGTVMGDLKGAVASILCALGDRLGLFKALAAGGPATSAELAERAGLDERYVREWLSALACTGYLQHSPVDGRFTLPPEHALVLAAEGSPFFMGGGYQQLVALLGPFERVAEAARQGGGIPTDAYADDLFEGMDRVSSRWFDMMLVPLWIPSLNGVQGALERGGLAVDIGCGGGRALVAMARAFPRSRFVGYDTDARSVQRARAAAVAAGVADRVQVERLDARDGLPESVDFVTIFNGLHDMAGPVDVLSAVRTALKPDGALLVLESNCSADLAENAGPVGAILYTTSLFYCLPTALARGAEGRGTMGLPESELRTLAAAAGLTGVRRVPTSDPFSALYELRP